MTGPPAPDCPCLGLKTLSAGVAGLAIFTQRPRNVTTLHGPWRKLTLQSYKALQKAF